MRQNYFKNAALLTGSDVVLRLAGMGLRIWLANALGGAGMGLYQLVLAVYGLFITLATAGISVAATRLLTEELSRDKAAARGMLVRLVLAGLTLGGLAMVAQLATAGLAAKWWLGDVRAAAALRTSALGLPWMAISAVLRIGGVAVLLPRYGMRGFLTVILLSSFYTCAANTGRLLLSSGTGHAFRRWLGAPLLAAVAAGAAGRGVRRALTGFPAQGLWEQLAVLTAGGTATAIVFLLAALPLGLWEELRAVLRQAKTGKNRGK